MVALRPLHLSIGLLIGDKKRAAFASTGFGGVVFYLLLEAVATLELSVSFLEAYASEMNDLVSLVPDEGWGIMLWL